MIVRPKQVKNILTKSKLPLGDFSANPYVGCAHDCKYCFASYMQQFSNHTEDWGKFVDVKYWPKIPNLEKLYGKEICIGSVTDGYQPLERQYGRTRELLTQLQGSGCKITIITKSDLVMRDLDLLQTFPQVQIAWSINTLNEHFRMDMDKGASIGQRFQAMQFFHAQGIKTSCFISPIFPEISEVFALIDYARDKCGEIWLEPLNLRGANRFVIFSYIAQCFPQLLPLYRRIFEQCDLSYWDYLSQQVAAFAQNRGLTVNGQAAYPLYQPCPNITCRFGIFQSVSAQFQSRNSNSQLATNQQQVSSTQVPFSPNTPSLQSPAKNQASFATKSQYNPQSTANSPSQSSNVDTPQDDFSDLDLFKGIHTP